MSKLQRGAFSVLIVAALSGAAVAAPCDEPATKASLIIPGAPLTLPAVMAEIRNASPDVRRAALETFARKSETDQAGRKLNPVIGLEVENFAGSGPLSGFGQSESTFTLSQTFELGNKRRFRRDAAQTRAALAGAECTAILRQAQLEGAVLFFELDASIKAADFADDAADLADRLVETVSKRVEAGAAAPPELLRARADATALRAASVVAKSRTEKLKYDLAALWGSANPQFSDPINVSLDAMSPGAVVDGAISDHPLLYTAKAQSLASQSVQDYARSQSMPDVTVSAGLRRFDESNDNAFLLGVSVPLPIFDRKRDLTKAASFRYQSSLLNRETIQRRLQSDKAVARAQLISAQQRLSLFQDALKDAKSAYEASVTGYQAGKFDLSTTLNARKALIEAGMAEIDAMRTVNIENMKLRSLISAAPFNGDTQ